MSFLSFSNPHGRHGSLHKERPFSWNLCKCVCRFAHKSLPCINLLLIHEHCVKLGFDDTSVCIFMITSVLPVLIHLHIRYPHIRRCKTAPSTCMSTCEPDTGQKEGGGGGASFWRGDGSIFNRSSAKKKKQLAVFLRWWWAGMTRVSKSDVGLYLLSNKESDM